MRQSSCPQIFQLPRRFLGVSAVEMPQWAPFGDGGRNCVGMKLAVEEAKVRRSRHPQSGCARGSSGLMSGQEALNGRGMKA